MKNKIQLLKQGDETVFKLIYNKYWKKVYRFAQLYLTDTFEIEETVQDVFIKLWEHKDMLDENEDLDGLLFIITRNRTYNQNRKSLNETALKNTLEQVEKKYCDIENQIVAEDLNRYVNILIQQLPPRQKETFILSRKQGLSNKEIAERLSISESGVKRNIHEALKFLKKNLPLFITFLNYNG